jgi:hypothetical protein
MIVVRRRCRQPHPLGPVPAVALHAAVLAFGVGYFDDAADVPGEPVLFFALCGSVEWDGAVRLGLPVLRAARAQHFDPPARRSGPWIRSSAVRISACCGAAIARVGCPRVNMNV